MTGRQFPIWLTPLCISLILAAAITWATDWIWRASPEIQEADATYSVRQFDRIPADPRIVSIQIDPATLATLNGPGGQETRLDRGVVAEMITELDRAKASVIVLDMFLGVAGTAKENLALERAIHGLKYARVVIGYPPGEDSTEYQMGAPIPFGRSAVLPDGTDRLVYGSLVGSTVGTKFIGVDLVQVDRFTGREIPNVALAAVALFRGVDPRHPHFDPERSAVTLGTLKVKTGSYAHIPIQWTQDPKDFRARDFAETKSNLITQSGALDVEGKLVVIGNPSSEEVITNSFGERTSAHYGMLNAINTLLQPDLRRDKSVDEWLVFAHVFLGSFGLMFSAFYFRTSTVLAWLSLGVMLGIKLPTMLTYVGYGFESGRPTIAAILAGFVSVGLSLLPQIVLPGAGRRGTVVFADLKASTAMVNRIGDIESRQVLLDLLVKLSRVLESHGAVVERFLGDGVMAVFADRESKHAVEAIRALAKDFQARGSADGELSLTCGAEYGHLARGLIRTRGRREWSSFGAIVNLAARLQGEAGARNCFALVGPGYAEYLTGGGDGGVVRECGSAVLKGFEVPVPVFEIAGIVETGETRNAE